jgi:hypothetical protein
VQYEETATTLTKEPAPQVVLHGIIVADKDVTPEWLIPGKGLCRGQALESPVLVIGTHTLQLVQGESIEHPCHLAVLLSRGF